LRKFILIGHVRTHDVCANRLFHPLIMVRMLVADNGAKLFRTVIL
jgi:hypothetical protein